MNICRKCTMNYDVHSTNILKALNNVPSIGIRDYKIYRIHLFNGFNDCFCFFFNL